MSKRIANGRRPAKPSPPEPKEMELLGLTEDGRLVLWSVDRVIPVTAFRYHRDAARRRWIDAGHFVIDWFGSDVVAHLGNLKSGKVSVQLMCNDGRTFALSRREAGSMLRYKVVKDPKVQAEILASLKSAIAAIVAAHDTPERQRGLHSRPELFRAESAEQERSAA